MHLDCVFSTLGGNCCIMLEDIMVGARRLPFTGRIIMV
jgi:hypothetical protein